MKTKPKRTDCKKCGNAIDGSHLTWCKSCYNAWKRDRYAKNREKEVARVIDYNRRNYPRFLENLARHRSGETYRKTRSAWENKNRELISVWNANKNARRRAAISATVTPITKDQWNEIKALFRNRCAYCGKRKKLTMDHRVALSRGGDHSAHNIVPACMDCNSRKNTKNEVYFYQQLGRLI